MSAEPSIDSAKLWWGPQRGVWTPIGWKDHLFRFNLLYNGTILAEPSPSQMPALDATKPYAGNDFQLTFHATAETGSPTDVHFGPPGDSPGLPDQDTLLYKLDGGVGIQGWREEHTAPVLWTEWPLKTGAAVRQDVFAHVPGNADVETGAEPIYSWVRLSVSHVSEVRPATRVYVAVQLSKIYVKHTLPWKYEDGVALQAMPALAPVPGGLTAVPLPAGGLRIDEASSAARLAVIPAGEAIASFTADHPNAGIGTVMVELPATEGAHVDLLLAMLPQPQADYDAELALGYDTALSQVDKFWSEVPAGAALVRTPEHQIDEIYRRSTQFAEIIAQKNPDNGEYTFLTGSYGYDCLWATPTSMLSHMFLDLFGHHDVVERHVELFHANQGTITPPGPTYGPHHGYFSSPKTLTSFDWFTDHGAILLTLTEHALLTGDQAFTDRWIDAIVAGCDFLSDAAARRDHDDVPGLPPASVGTDDLVPTQSVWNLAWSYKALASAVRLLKRLDHPRAEEFGSFAADFKTRFAAAFRARSAEAPQWTAPDGTRHPVPVIEAGAPKKHHIFDGLIDLDSGAMVAVWAGLLDADDPLMRSAVRYFREGPNVRLYGYRSNPIDRAILVHEQSSGEPCYSWNIVHSWQLGDRERFLEGMYGLFTGGIAEHTYISSEHRNGMYGNLFTTALMFWLARHAVIDDSIVDGEVHLLRLAPLAWLSESEETVFDNLPTYHGPVDLRWQVVDGGRGLRVSFTPRWRGSAPPVVLHVPPLDGLTYVVLNGTRHETAPGGTLSGG